MSQEGVRTYADVCMKHGLQHPFLMQQMLATSALHISISEPDRREVYHRHSVQLQSDALVGFNAALENLNEHNIIAAFLVSSLIGLHSFCETFSFRDGHFSNTIDSFIGCTNLLRGVKSLIGEWWPYLLSTELNSVLKLARDKRDEGRERSQRLEELRRLVASADIGSASKKAYEVTVEELELVFTSLYGIEAPESNKSSDMIFAWLVLVPKEYVDLLSQRRPEALVILAYYAIVLHHRRGFWAVNDAGQFLIQGIASHLGKHWDAWLALPKSEIID